MNTIKVQLPVVLLTGLFLILGCNSEDRQRPQLQFTISNSTESGSRFPNMYSEDGQTLFMSWLLRIEEEMFALQFASFEDGRWQEPQTVHIGNHFFANWADFPSVVTKDREPVAVHWLKKIEGGPYAYDVQLAFPGEQDRRWNHITPHRDSTATEHGFVSMIPLEKDKVLAVWLDGRHTEHREHDEYEDMSKAMTLRSAEISADGTIERERVIDDAVCDCCQTDLIATDDEAVAVYRNRAEGEIRDISITRYDFNSGEWSEPSYVAEDNWQIGGCPVNGPRVATDGNKIAVAWFTAADETPRVLTAISEDGGRNFTSPVQVNTGETLGRVDIEAANNSFYISYMDRRNELSAVYLRKLDTDGTLTDPVMIGTTDRARHSGFPRIAALSDGIMFAWTQTEPMIRVRTAFYSFDVEDQFVMEQ